MPYQNEHACRLNPPDKYDRFARKNCEQKSDGKCIDVIYGVKGGKSEIQALRYPKTSWSEAAARSHCRGRDGTFEPAAKENATYKDFCLQEVTITDEFQMILPIGTHYSAFYGKITITRQMIEQMVDNWRNRVMGNREPYIDTDHDGGAANGWIKELEAREDGLYAKIEWTEHGRELITSGQYRYFSAEFGTHVDVRTGDKHYPVLIAATLTNRPLMNQMPPARAASDTELPGDEATTDGAAGVDILNITGGGKQ